jgi:hypothetical protein
MIMGLVATVSVFLTVGSWMPEAVVLGYGHVCKFIACVFRTASSLSPSISIAKSILWSLPNGPRSGKSPDRGYPYISFGCLSFSFKTGKCIQKLHGKTVRGLEHPEAW